MSLQIGLYRALLLGMATLATPAAAETAIERGDYLVNTIGSCGNCYTRDAASHIPGAALSGGHTFDEDYGYIIGPNITPDQPTGIGDWTDADIVTALRDGKRPNGTIIGPPMPAIVYRQLSDGDAEAIAAYLRSRQPVSHHVDRSQYKIACHRAMVPRSPM